MEDLCEKLQEICAVTKLEIRNWDIKQGEILEFTDTASQNQ